MTWAERIAGKKKRLSLVILIQGIETVFKETGSFSYSTYFSPTRQEYECIVDGSIEEGEQSLDFMKRCVLGGSLTFSLKEKRGQTILANLFRPRLRRTTFVGASATSAAATINVNDTAGLAASGTVYMGPETITYTSLGVGPPILLGCTRGAFSSRAVPQSFSGSSSMSCADVFTSVPFWRGRRVYLKGVFLDELGSPVNSGNFQDLGTYTIEESPQMDEGGLWKISCAPMADDIAARKCYIGFKEKTFSQIYYGSAVSGARTVYVDQAVDFTQSASGNYMHALLRFQNGECGLVIPTAVDLTVGTNFLTVIDDPALFASGRSIMSRQDTSYTETDGILGGKIIPVLVQQLGPPGLAYILGSDKGNAELGSLDVLPGKIQIDAMDYTTRVGAAIPTTEINSASFTSVAEPWTWSYILDKTTDAGDILRDFCLAYDAFWLISDGKVATKKLGSVATASSFTFSKSNIVAGTLRIEYDETAAHSTMTVRTNYSPAVQDFRLTMNILDRKMAQRFPQQMDSLEYEMNGISVLTQGVAPDSERFVRMNEMNEIQFEDISHRWQRVDARGRLVISLTADTPALSVAIGDVVSVNFPSLPDLEGGTLASSGSSLPYRVISRRPNYANGTVDIRMCAMEKMYLVAPSAIGIAISTTTIANDTLTISPGLAATYFAVGVSLRLWDVSAGTSQLLTVSSFPAADKIKFTAGIAGALESGVDWVEWGDIATVSQTNGAGHGEGDYQYVYVLRRWQ